MEKDRMKILEMIQNKTITAKEGADLLRALENDKDNIVQKIQDKKSAFKMFKIKILSGDGDKVNVQIPIEFAKVALRNGKGFMKMDQIQGMDLDIEMILDMIDKGAVGKIVDIESADGDTIEIVIE
ncbi:MAG: SHOCT-like domain-containing protein [Candidatus Izemoplasmataceae bacterium]